MQARSFSVVESRSQHVNGYRSLLAVGRRAARTSGGMSSQFKFGQRVDLCARLRECLANYPEDGLLKEMVQNADDAGATIFKVMLDKRKHPERKLLLDGLAPFQGAAICTFNDAAFTEKDIASIQNVGNSLKNDDDGRAKTGKFGLGFNSCYHVTDCPGLMTAGQLMFLDPSQTRLGNDDTGVGFTITRQDVERKPDQFVPWRIFGCEPSSGFGGTIFRLPLRTMAHVRSSRGEGISQRPFSLKDADELVRKFVDSLPELVLFLQSVQTVQVYEWPMGAGTPRLLWEQTAREDGRDDATPRAHLRGLLAHNASHSLKRIGEHQFNNRLTVQLSSQASQGGGSSQGAGGAEQGETAIWLVAQAFGGGKALAMSVDEDVLSRGLKPLPWGGVAARVQRQLQVGDDGQSKRPRVELAVRGRPFCTLPLPTHTGLPVHVNGFFELTTSRRDVWSDTSGVGSGRVRAEWNVALLQSVVAPCYAALLHEARELADDAAAYYALWPQARPSEPWAHLVDELYARTPRTCTHARAEIDWSGRLLFPTCRYTLLIERDCLRLELPDGSKEWVAPSKAIFAPDAMERELRTTLLQLHVPLVEPPDELVALLRGACHHPAKLRTATPTAVRQHLATLPHGWESNITDSQCVRLLEHCLLDLSSEGRSQTSEAPAQPDHGPSAVEGDLRILDEVKRLPLLPLMDGRRTSFEAATSCLVMCAADDWSLRPSPALVVAIEPASTLGCRLTELTEAFDRKLSLMPAMPLELLPSLLLPTAWHKTHGQRLAETDGAEGGRSAAELGRVLAFIARHHSQVAVRDIFGEWPIVPATDECAYTIVAPADGMPPMLRLWDPELSMTSRDLLSCLMRLGCKQLHPVVREQHSQPEMIALHPCVHARAPVLSAESVLKALCIIAKPEIGAADADMVQLKAKFSEQLSEAAPAEQHGLRDCLAANHGLVGTSPPVCTQAPPLPRTWRPFESQTASARTHSMCAVPAWTADSPEVRTMIRSLPIFQTEGLDENVFTHIDLKANLRPPLEVSADIVAWVGNFLCNKTSVGGVRTINTNLDELLNRLEVPKLEMSTFYLKQVLPRLPHLPNALRNRTMCEVVRKLASISIIDTDGPQLKAALRAAAFVPSGISDSHLYRPSELFDPGILTTRFGGHIDDGTRVAWFPHSEWADDTGLVRELLVLGLRTSVTRRFISETMVVQSCQIEDGGEMARAILHYMSYMSCMSTEFLIGDDDGDITPEEFSSKLCELKWLPVLTAAPDGLPWPTELHVLPRVTAREARPNGDAALVSATARVLAFDERPLPPELLKLLGWHLPPAVSVLLAQLQAMATLSVDGLSRQVLTELCANVNVLYTALEAAFSSIESEDLSDEDNQKLQGLGATPCLWLEQSNVFVSPRRVARFSGSANLEPHLFRLPALLTRYDTVMTKLGVREAFDAADYDWAVKESRTTPFDEKPPAAKLRALCQGGRDREGADEAFMSTSILNEIKGILQQYPEGDTVLNELLQNADDAGATVVRLVLEDESVQHGTASLWPMLQERVDDGDGGACGGVPWQGPALYCYNDGPGFSDDDFAAIRHIRAESKGTQNAASGRFGLGFNSVYHLTDAPALLSNGRWSLFDPHRNAFSTGGTEVALAVGTGGVDYDADTASNPADFADQFAPLCLFGGEGDTHWDMRSRYSGTLLRLPLRRAGDTTKLGRAYSHEKAHNLLERLRTRGPELLLFLKNVRRIEVYARGSAQNGIPLPQLRFRVERHDNDAGADDAGEDGRAIVRRVQGVSERAELYAQLVVSAPTLEIHKLSMRVTSAGEVESESRWVVCSALTMTDEMQALCVSDDADGLKLIPWGGVAARIGHEQTLKGAAFSFLPLPVETGLPVHVNGYFEMADDRERLWTMRDGLEGVAAVKAQWNQHLISEVLSLCYCKLLTLLAALPHQDALPLKQFFALWPAETIKPWDGLVERLYRRVALERVLPGPEAWLRPLPAGDEQQSGGVLRAEQDAAVQGFMQALFETANTELTRAGQGVLRVVLPSPVLKLLQDALQALGKAQLRKVDPQLARRVLRRSVALWPGKSDWLENLPRPSGVRLLRFCLSETQNLDAHLKKLGENGGADVLSGLPFVPILAPPDAPQQSRWASITSPCSAPRLVLLSPTTLDKLGLFREAAQRQPVGWIDTFLYQGLRIVDTHALNGFENGKPFEMLRSVANARMVVSFHNESIRKRDAFCFNLIHGDGGTPALGDDEAFRLNVWVSKVLAEAAVLQQLRLWVVAPGNAAALRRWIVNSCTQLEAVDSLANERNERALTREEVRALKTAIRALPAFGLPPAVQAGQAWHREVNLLPQLEVNLLPQLQLPGDVPEQPPWWRDVRNRVKQLAGLAGERWLQCTNVQEERMFRRLEVQQPQSAQFFVEQIFPRLPELAQELPPATIHEFVMHVLTRSDRLVQQGGDLFVNALRGVACVSSPFGLLQIGELTHPSLRADDAEDYDAAFVPSNIVLPDIQTSRLAKFGLHARGGFLAAARRVDSDRAATVVWECLVRNCAALLNEQPAQDGAHERLAQFVQQLKEHLKVPVLTQGEAGMPWPAEVHAQPFAPCAEVRPHEDRFLVSATLQVVAARPERIPPVLCEALGWGTPVRCEVLLQQLRAAVLPVGCVPGVEQGLAGPSKAQMLALYEALDSDETADWAANNAEECQDLLGLACVMVNSVPDRVVLQPPRSVAFTLQHGNLPAVPEARPTRYTCLACRSTQLGVAICTNQRCPSHTDSAHAQGLVQTSQPSLATYSLNSSLHEVHPECEDYNTIFNVILGVPDSFTAQDYGWAPHHFTLQCAARRYLARRRIASWSLQAAARGLLARRRSRWLRSSLAGEALTAVHTAVQRTGRSSTSLLLCSVVERLPEVRGRRGRPDNAALTAYHDVSQLLREAAQQATTSAATTSPASASDASHAPCHLARTAPPDGCTVDGTVEQAMSLLHDARRVYQDMQAAIESADDEALEDAQSARDASRARLIATLEAAEQAKLRLAGASSGRELEGMARAAAQRRRAFADATRSASEAANLDPKLGSRAAAPLNTREDASAHCAAAVLALDLYVSPLVVHSTETAADRCSNAMRSVDLFAAASDPAAAAASVLRALRDAIAAESGFWKSYSAVDAFPAPMLLTASRAEQTRLASLAAWYSALLAEASQLAAERAMHQEAASIGGVQSLMTELKKLQDELIDEQDNLEDAATKLRRATRAHNASGNPAAAEAAQSAARDAVNTLERQLLDAHARAHEQLQLFPELARHLKKAVPLELAPIYCENRTLHQCAPIL